MDKQDILLPDNTGMLVQDDEEQEIVSLAGYQVTKAQFFAHQRDPAVTIWADKMKFNMACLKRFPGITHIQLLIHPDEKRLIIRPCDRDTPDSLKWAIGGTESEIKTRDMVCRIFAAKLFELMKWDSRYRYKMLGKPAISDGEILYLFKLTDFEFSYTEANTKRRKLFLTDSWRDCFGPPVEEHEQNYKINLADGYIGTGNM